MTSDGDTDVGRIAAALEESAELASTFSPSSVYVHHKGWDGPVTEADHALDELLHRALVRPGEGWLSEETHDDGHRIGMERVWVVDPIDGTRGFLAGTSRMVRVRRAIRGRGDRCRGNPEPVGGMRRISQNVAARPRSTVTLPV